MSGGAAAGASRLLHTPFHAQHVAAGARMVDFGGWDMPVQYPTGIIAEHLATRSGAGLFDVAHMGRFGFRGPGRRPSCSTCSATTPRPSTPAGAVHHDPHRDRRRSR